MKNKLLEMTEKEKERYYAIGDIISAIVKKNQAAARDKLDAELSKLSDESIMLLRLLVEP